jgi:hypothetical protein
MNDLANCVLSPLIMYADDSTLYRVINDYNDEVRLQNDLNSIQLSCINNGMRFNETKCVFIDVTLSKFRRFGRYFLIDFAIPHAEYVKILGVFVAFDLSWNHHVEYIRAKCARLLRCIHRNMKECTPRVKSQYFQTLVRPVMFHGIPGCHPTTIQNSMKLQ